MAGVPRVPAEVVDAAPGAGFEIQVQAEEEVEVGVGAGPEATAAIGDEAVEMAAAVAWVAMAVGEAAVVSSASDAVEVMVEVQASLEAVKDAELFAEAAAIGASRALAVEEVKERVVWRVVVVAN